jgi:ComF family protein
VRSSIHRFKYDGEFARAGSLSAELNRIQADLGPVNAIVPVPIHGRRLRERGFNQSTLMARHLASIWELDFNEALERRVDGERQVGKSRDERWTNVAGVFACTDASTVRNQRVVVLDDVITTGATVSECAVALVKAGARSVVGISIARG